MNTVLIGDKRGTKIIAHRGLSGIERENTLPAFVAAGNRSYFGIECDVHVTKDGKYLIYHDDRTGRLCEQDVPMEESTAAKLRGLRILETGKDTFSDSNKMPYLREYLAVCARYGKIAVIELKTPICQEQVAKIMRLCGELYDLDKIVFISFCFENLIAVRKCREEQTVQFLCWDYNDELRERLKDFRFDLDIEYSRLTQSAVSELHDAGIRVNCWTCDDKAAAEELISWGVDFITTNILE